MKTKLEIGQKYRVIKDCLGNVKNGTIITVSRLNDILPKKIFYDETGYKWEIGSDKLQLITPKSKKVSKWKYSREKVLLKLGFLFNSKGEYNAPYEVNGEELYKLLFSKQSQPIKQEDKKVEMVGVHCKLCGHYHEHIKCIEPKLEDKVKEIEKISLKKRLLKLNQPNK